MQLRKRQAGLGMLGWLIVLGIFSFALTCTFKIGPIYLDYWQVKKALDLVMGNSQSAGQSREQLLAAVQKQLDVSRIEAVSSKDMKVIEGRGGRELNANYEKRIPFMYNIDVVVKFDKLVYNLSAAE